MTLTNIQPISLDDAAVTKLVDLLKYVLPFLPYGTPFVRTQCRDAAELLRKMQSDATDAVQQAKSSQEHRDRDIVAVTAEIVTHPAYSTTYENDDTTPWSEKMEIVAEFAKGFYDQSTGKHGPEFWNSHDWYESLERFGGKVIGLLQSGDATPLSDEVWSHFCEDVFIPVGWNSIDTSV